MSVQDRGRGWTACLPAMMLAGLLWGRSCPDLQGARPTQQGPTRQVTSQRYRVQLDLSSQVLRLSILDDKDYSFSEKKGKQEAPLAPVLSKLAGPDLFVSGSMLAQKAKEFDDGLYAAVDLTAEHGLGSFPGKALLLQSLCKALSETSEPRTPTAAMVLAAAQLGKLDITLPANARQPVHERLHAFLHDELRSRPIGFYTWNKDLSALFQQDRLLETNLNDLEDGAGIERLARALHQDSRARAGYQAYLELVSRLTNPFPPEYRDLRPLLADLDRGELKIPRGKVCFFPPSQAHETELVKKMFGDEPVPEDFNLVDTMIQRIRAGDLKLQPTPRSGW